MKTANQLTFTTCEASLKLNPNDLTKIIFDNIDRLGDDIFYESLHQLIAQAIALKVIPDGDTAIDSTYLWAYLCQPLRQEDLLLQTKVLLPSRLF